MENTVKETSSDSPPELSLLDEIVIMTILDDLTGITPVGCVVDKHYNVLIAVFRQVDLLDGINSSITKFLEVEFGYQVAIIQWSANLKSFVINTLEPPDPQNVKIKTISPARKKSKVVRITLPRIDMATVSRNKQYNIRRTCLCLKRFFYRIKSVTFNPVRI